MSRFAIYEERSLSVGQNLYSTGQNFHICDLDSYISYGFIACPLKEPPSFFHRDRFLRVKDLNLEIFRAILQIQKGKAKTHGLPSDNF